MSKDELITKQQLQIEEMKQKIKDMEGAKRIALSHIYCIGGPLNDNRLGYSKPQMVTFARIAEELESA